MLFSFFFIPQTRDNILINLPKTLQMADISAWIQSIIIFLTRKLLHALNTKATNDIECVTTNSTQLAMT